MNFLLFLFSVLLVCSPVVLPASVDFTYEGETGPSYWGSLDSSFATCSVGHAQSPVDITAAIDTTNTLAIHYTDINGNVLLYLNHHSAYTYQLGGNTPNNGSYVTWNGLKYNLQQYHFHYPSEHHINSRAHSLEVHFVHALDPSVKQNTSSLLVIGVLFELRQINHFIQNSVKPFLNVPSTAVNVSTAFTTSANLSIATFMSSFDTTKWWSYAGSLTTPPCSEGVQWVVMQNIHNVSAKGLAMLRTAQDANNRLTQPKDGRNIK